MRTRFAPTPSGFLHRGNIYNMLLIFEEAQRLDGEVHLRIDDIDAARTQGEYVDDIFSKLNFFYLSWYGPQNSEEFFKNFSQQLKLDLYWEQLLKHKDSLKLYSCLCSRKDLAVRGCPCSLQHHPLQKKGFNIKSEVINEHPILWRKEGLASYHWMSVIEDEQLRITHLYRGMDLLESSRLQWKLADLLDFKHFKAIQFIHHPLLTIDKKKLSKSTLKKSMPWIFDPKEIRAEFHGWKKKEKSNFLFPGIF